MQNTTSSVHKVAVIGAGVSGVAAAVHLKRAGLHVSVFERSSRAGGVWVYNDKVANDAAYPSVLPSTGDSPAWEQLLRQQRYGRDSPIEHLNDSFEKADASSYDASIAFAPPGPCYQSLRNNVSTIEMEMTCHKWNPGTEEFVPHYVLADYIQDAARSNGLAGNIHFSSRVDRVEKVDGVWEVDVSRLDGSGASSLIVTETLLFDAVVVASGHYHACNVPNILGLAELKRAFPEAVQHSKLYRSAGRFNDRTVLLIGGGVSSLDIAKDLGNVARLVFQSTRDGPYDLPAHLLPNNAVRVGPIESFELAETAKGYGALGEAGKVKLADGQTICEVDHVIVCTGYHVSLPWMRQYHADGVQSGDADNEVLVTDGQQIHNLHKDIWYIPDPTLAFIGVPYHVATFSTFDFQAIALATVFSGEVPLPSTLAMRQEYNERLKSKGAGRTFHSLKEDGDEAVYVNELAEMVNKHRGADVSPMAGHTKHWHEAYARRLQRKTLIFSPAAAASKPRRTHASLVIG